MAWFICERCNACCRWPGFVKLSDAEIARLSAFLGVSEPEFIDRYTELLPSRKGLTLKSRANHECILFDGQGCSAHPVKPDQCKGFPNRWNFPGWRQVCRAVEVGG